MRQTSMLYSGRKAPLSLHIVIVGCGIAGLSAAFCLGEAGHRITVVESAAALSDIGAGIQISPNMSRLLIRWGLGKRLDELAVRPQSVAFCRYDTGERVGYTLFGEKMEKEHGAPYYQVHRADLLAMLHDIARPWMDLRLASKATSVDPHTPSITLESGEVLAGDLIIGADGVKSVVRESLVEGPDQPVPTGDAAYRVTIPISGLMSDPELRPLVETPATICWMGPGRHIIGYSIRGAREYNMVMLHPDTGSVESWTEAANVDEMRATYAGWEPRVRKLQALATAPMESRLVLRPPLKTWVHPSGRVTLLGDSCHSMLPYRAQGAAMAVEDAAVLGNLFSRISSKGMIARLLRAYQDLRHPRATATQQASWSNRDIFHLPDGPAQEARDASMREAMEDVLKEERGELCERPHIGNLNAWADKVKSIEQFSYDADQVVNDWWQQEGQFMLEICIPGSISRISCATKDRVRAVMFSLRC